MTNIHNIRTPHKEFPNATLTDSVEIYAVHHMYPSDFWSTYRRVMVRAFGNIMRRGGPYIACVGVFETDNVEFQSSYSGMVTSI